METLADVTAYFKTVEKWRDEDGLVAYSGDRHLELYEFKETIDLGLYKAKFEFTNSDEAYAEGETDGDVEDVTWWVSFPKLGRAGLHLYCTHAAENMGYWAEFWFKKEPSWYEDDPYECTSEQIGAIVRALPAKHRAKFEELVSRSPSLMATLRESGILETNAPTP